MKVFVIKNGPLYFERWMSSAKGLVQNPIFTKQLYDAFLFPEKDVAKEAANELDRITKIKTVEIKEV